ncbi:MAG: FCD domain-containing protein [Rhizomicrobium sp.]|nr:FCD domain-containing protein [Rhizomicrobium sp.]
MARSEASTRTHRIVEALGGAIVSGTYSPQHPFPIEADLCIQYSVSRTVLREAVKMLTAKGLLSARPRHGTWIQPEAHWNLLDPDVLRWLLERKITFSALRDFAQMRLAIEPPAAALAARVATADAKAAIRAAIHEMALAEENETDALVSEIAFHSAILRASGNCFFAQLSGVTETALRFSLRMQDCYHDGRKRRTRDHQRIADAIFAGDPVAAEEAARLLLKQALNFIDEADDTAEPALRNAS